MKTTLENNAKRARINTIMRRIFLFAVLASILTISAFADGGAVENAMTVISTEIKTTVNAIARVLGTGMLAFAGFKLVLSIKDQDAGARVTGITWLIIGAVILVTPTFIWSLIDKISPV